MGGGRVEWGGGGGRIWFEWLNLILSTLMMSSDGVVPVQRAAVPPPARLLPRGHGHAHGAPGLHHGQLRREADYQPGGDVLLLHPAHPH